LLSSFLTLLLIFLFPVAVYCVVLAMLNRRPQPTMVRGALDFFGLLFAASGLLLYAGPEIIKRFFLRSINDSPFGERGPSGEVVGHLWWWYWFAWGAYYTLVLGGAAFLLWWRRSKTVVYNIAPADFDRAIDLALGRLRLEATRSGNRLFLGFGGTPVPEPDLAAISATPLKAAVDPSAVRMATGEAVVDIESFAALWNVTLHWRSHSGEVRREVEEELARALSDVRSYDNPVATWFLGVAGFLFALIFMVVLVLLLGLFIPPRR
jgi:hypothetical protein